MTVILVTGYRHTDLGIFQEKDKRVSLIKKVIRRQIERYLDEGVDWFILTGQLGFEYWFLEEALAMQKEAAFSIGTIFCFENHGENWSEANQEKLARFKAVDFVKYSYPHYTNPSQFRHYNQFLIDNSDEAYLFYDAENETNLKYLANMMQEKEDYPIKRLDFDTLNDFAQDGM